MPLGAAMKCRRLSKVQLVIFLGDLRMKALFILVAASVSAALLAACGGGTTGSARLPISALPSTTGQTNVGMTTTIDATVGRKLYVLNTSGDSVTVYAPGGTLPKRTISKGMNEPDTMALCGSGTLYVSDLSSVKVYARLKSSVRLTIPGGASALACDSLGNLYVGRGNAVAVYGQRGKRLLRTIYQGINNPQALAFDSSGNLYVANYNNATITVYAPGSTSVLRTISQGLGETRTLAFDIYGNLYAANWGTNTVTAYAPGSTNVLLTISQGIAGPWGLTTDASGNVYVGNTQGGSNPQTVTVYAEGSTAILRTITQDVDIPLALAVDRSGNLYVANAGERSNGTVTVYAPGSTSVLRTISHGISTPQALAFGP
jgi:sugar lactone lactonase YvrE